MAVRKVKDRFCPLIVWGRKVQRLNWEFREEWRPLTELTWLEGAIIYASKSKRQVQVHKALKNNSTVGQCAECLKIVILVKQKSSVFQIVIYLYYIFLNRECPAVPQLFSKY